VNRRVNVTVRGRVQNVGFRVFVQRRAVDYGLTGWVANQDVSDCVELEAEGPDHAIELLLAAVQHGPTAARVSVVNVNEMNASGHAERTFQIR
jgi:acylphosphatase